ncbi:hypothetical protein SCLCIDRAFT_202027 [Scleroderma citrinum Foug A]|uniref:Uncharacterized protein n=1 Tax=Scleroderma citrinum Foug A TaxID=1036808 RepID=A0A0C2Z4P4_9AGAM|nr:hypothetical protein SCLCIDRAFT_202027 [Scleroderma citrinum Foug A]
MYKSDIAPVPASVCQASAKGVFTARLLLTHTPRDRPKRMDFKSSVDNLLMVQKSFSWLFRYVELSRYLQGHCDWKFALFRRIANVKYSYSICNHSPIYVG